jgi:hypothetical protein
MTKLSRQNVGGIDYTMVGCTLTGVCASAASDYVKTVTLSDGDILSDGMSVVITFANGNTAGTAPASLTIYSSDQVNYYSDSGLTQPFTLAPSGCYEIEYTGTGNAYTYTSYPVVQIEGVTAPLCDSCGKKTSGAVWDAGDTVLMLYSGNKFMVVSGLTNVVTAGSRKAVTSGAVAAAIDNSFNLPTDAVLHYSFDEVPDYPDGNADVRREYGDTYTNLTEYCYGNATQTITNVNGNLHCKSTVSYGGIYLRNDVASSKISIVKVKVIKGTVAIGTLGDVKSIGTWVVSRYVDSSFYIASATAEETEWELEYIYIGDGSYSTPIIDNANGQNNATNNGGIATKGVSGKCAYFVGGTYTVIEKNGFTLKPPYTQSFWCKIGANVTGTQYIVDGRSSENAFNTDEGVLFLANNKIEVGSNNGGLVVTASGIVRPNQWQHIVVMCESISGGNRYTIYVDGVPVKVGETSVVNDGFAKLTIGNRFAVIAGTITERMIDDFQIFGRTLSAEEVMALYLNKANTPKYFPTPTNEIKEGSLELATSGGVYSALHGANIASSVFTVTANWIANHTIDIRKLGNFLVCNIFVQVTTAQTLSSATKIATLSIKPSSNLRALGAVENTGVVIKAEINSQGDLTIAPFSGSVSVSGYIRFESIIFPIAAS